MILMPAVAPSGPLSFLIWVESASNSFLGATQEEDPAGAYLVAAGQLRRVCRATASGAVDPD